MLKVADRWFERREVDDTITQLWEPHVIPFIRCNIWHVRGRDRDALIDTGLGIASLAAAADLFAHDLLAIATHTHYDHSGGMHEFDTRIVHRAEAASLREGEGGMYLKRGDYSDAECAQLADAGCPLHEENFLRAVPHQGFDPDGHILEPAPPTRVVDDGDVIDLGDRVFEVLHLPGHSPGSMGLFEHETGTLFSGDAIYDGPLLDNIEGADIADYILTMERLKRLPVRVIHGGHDPSFDATRLHEIADRYLRKWGA